MTRRRKKSQLAVVAPFPTKKEEPRWSPLSMLEEFTEKVRSGEITADCVMVFYVEVDKEKRQYPRYWTQNVGVERQIAFAEWLKMSALEDWKAT